MIYFVQGDVTWRHRDKMITIMRHFSWSKSVHFSHLTIAPVDSKVFLRGNQIAGIKV
jgi:hypothetical protein